MGTTRSGRLGRIVARPTATEDLDFVLAAEAVPENARGILAWPREAHLAVMADADAAHWVIEAVPDGRAVGFLIMRGLAGPDRSVELKRILVTEKGAGYGREAMQLAKTMAFDQLGAHRLWLDVFPDNERALRLYESEGFVREGVLRECHRSGDGFRSLIILSMLDREYEDRGQRLRP